MTSAVRLPISSVGSRACATGKQTADLLLNTIPTLTLTNVPVIYRTVANVPYAYRTVDYYDYCVGEKSNCG